MQQTVEINNKNEREKRTARRGAPGAPYSSFVHEIAGCGKGNRHRARKPFADEEIPQIIGRHQIENLPTILVSHLCLKTHHLNLPGSLAACSLFVPLWHLRKPSKTSSGRYVGKMPPCGNCGAFYAVCFVLTGNIRQVNN